MKSSDKFDLRLLLFILGIYKINELLYAVSKIKESWDYILINIDIKFPIEIDIIFSKQSIDKIFPI